jgi:aminoglycoside phosphotransferase (APT) family kinase protein
MTPIDAALARRLVASQFPQWADLPVAFVGRGHDNRTFRLGARMSLRLPSAARYAEKVAKEHRLLPLLAAGLPLPIPTSLAVGRPDAEFPWPWSVRTWIDGDDAASARVDDLAEFASALGAFLVALRRVDSTGGPPPGAHNFHRGAPPAVYDDETRAAVASLAGRIDADAATSAWDAALDSTWSASPVWLHGDVAPGNLLVRGGRLAAVIDFGGCGVGDPACDLAIAWTTFSGPSRAAFRDAVDVDDATWIRGRGWALWKALITLRDGDEGARRVVDEILRDAGG